MGVISHSASDQPVAVSEGRCSCARRNEELVEDIAEVAVHGPMLWARARAIALFDGPRQRGGALRVRVWFAHAPQPEGVPSSERVHASEVSAARANPAKAPRAASNSSTAVSSSPRKPQAFAISTRTRAAS